jgi:cell division protein FtsW (lipid II flippase)
MLVAVLIPHVGRSVNGARRWIPLGFMSFQPSELAKLAMVFYAASYMVRKMEIKERFFRAVLPMGVAVVVVGMLVMAEPDMGAFMVIAVIAMGILFLGGVNARMFFVIATLVVIAVSLMLIVSSSVMVANAKREVSDLGDEVAALEKEAEFVTDRLESQINYLEIYKIATEQYGMIPASMANSMYVDKTEGNTVESFEEEDEGKMGLSTLLSAIGIHIGS